MCKSNNCLGINHDSIRNTVRARNHQWFGVRIPFQTNMFSLLWKIQWVHLYYKTVILCLLFIPCLHQFCIKHKCFCQHIYLGQWRRDLRATNFKGLWPWLPFSPNINIESSSHLSYYLLLSAWNPWSRDWRQWMGYWCIRSSNSLHAHTRTPGCTKMLQTHKNMAKIKPWSIQVCQGFR